MIKLFKVLLFLLCSVSLFAQVNRDAGMWNTLSVKHELNKKLDLVVDQEFRLRENYQRINLFYTNFGVSYKINKNFKVDPTYRFIQKKRLEGTYSFRHRLMLDMTAKKKFDKISISERVRYQIEVQDYLTHRKGKLAEQFLRFKTDLKCAISSSITTYVSCELRYQIKAQRTKNREFDSDFHRIRNAIGVEYEINKKNSVNLYYVVQSEFNISTPESIYILGLGYSLSI